MKSKTLTLIRNAARKHKRSMRDVFAHADMLARESLDALETFSAQDLRDYDALARDMLNDRASDDSRAFFHDIELNHAHSRRVAF